MTGTEQQDPNERIVDALHRIVRTIQSEGDLPRLLTTIMEESQFLTDAEASSLFLFDADKRELYFEVLVGGDEGIRQIRVPLGQGIVGSSAENRETIVVNDCESDSRHLKVGSGGFVTRNLIATPMIRNDRLIGVLEVLNKRNGADFDPMDSKIIEIMAEQAAAQIENARLIKDKLKAERLAALGTTAAGLAHYIKNILSQWQGSAKLIDIGLERGNDDLIKDAWPILKRSNLKISKLVQDMLAISKEREPEREPVNLNQMVGQILEECKGKAEAGRITLAGALDPNLPEAHLDPNRIHDVLLNLVGNAMEAIEEAMMDNAQVVVATSFDPTALRITLRVEDTGPGMDEEVTSRIFEPFYSTKGSKGTGLGLAVASKTIEEHGGKLALKSAPGAGSTFFIDLPYLKPEPPPEASRA